MTADLGKEPEPPAGTPTDATTLQTAVAALEEKGYRGQFIAAGCGDLRCAACSTVHHAADLRLEDLIRLEGVSDPADMLAVVALTCSSCKTAGTIVLGYGPDSSVDDAEILSALEE